MSEAGWTADKPTVEGWYWYKADNTTPSIAYVEHITYLDGTAEWHVIFKSGTARTLRSLKGEWLGPITPDAYAAGRMAGVQEAIEQVVNLIMKPPGLLDAETLLTVHDALQEYVGEQQAQGGER